MITAKIDVTKIEKARLYKGEKGTYLDVVLIPTPDNSYGNDYMIVQSVTKEEKDAGVKGAILGNAKVIKKTDPVPVTQAEQDDLPF